MLGNLSWILSEHLSLLVDCLQNTPCEMPQTKGIFLKDELIDKSTLMREDVKLKKDENEKNIISIANSIKIERNFDYLTTINISDSVVEKVLLELKEPTGAKQALSFFYWCVRSKNHVHSVRCYCILVQILVRAKLLAHAQVLLESAIIKNEREDASELKIADTILSTYKITQSIPFVFNILIQTYAKLRMFELAFDACRHLHEQGFPSSVISYNTMIRYAEKSNKCPLIWKIYEYMIAKRIYPNQDTVKILVNVMCKEGTLQKSISILDKIHGRRCVPAIIVNTCLIFRIFKEKRVEEGITLVKRMLQKNLILDDIANSLIIHGYCLKGNLDMAHELYGEMIKKGISTNAFLFTSFIGQHCANKRIEEAQCLVQQMQEAGMMMYDDTYNSLVEGFCKDGRIEEGLAFYKEMLAKGLVPGDIVVDILIRKLCEIGEVETANSILGTLLDKGFCPKEILYSYLIDGYGKKGDAQQILKLYYEMEHKGYNRSLITYSSLIRNLCYCGKLNEAEHYISVMEAKTCVPTILLYETLISKHCEKGDSLRALHQYDQMIKRKLTPSFYIFKLLITIMHSAGHIKEATTLLPDIG